MAGRNFQALLEARWDKGKFLCIGLDSDFEKIPLASRHPSVRETIVAFNRAIVDATKDIACAYKPNSAFYEEYGDEGFSALRETIAHINEHVPELPVILDAKRADIGNTNNGYIAAAFDYFHADAITVQPYAGKTALEPFLQQKDKGIIVWCRSSNEGAGEFQDLEISGEPLYMHVARHVTEEWNTNGNCALVVGATYPEELKKIRAISDVPFLIPGIGAQNGDLAKTVAAGKDSRGRGMIINASRSVIFASSGPDFAEAAARSAETLNDAIRKAL
ncbi:MAG TPA: orotidine-5'-phosphate decarboxylase [Candidatus Paceibacterota bacterium]